MNRYSFSHLGDEALARELHSTATRERGATATVLAQIGEFERRRLFLPAAFPSMLDYCIGVLGYTRQAALKRLRVARLARRFPQILNSVAAGRLCLSGVIQLARHLSNQNGSELLAAAEGKTRAEIAQLLASRTPRLDVPTGITPVAANPHVPLAMGSEGLVSPGTPVSEALVSPGTPAVVAPLSEEKLELHATISRDTGDLMREAMALLGVNSSEVDAVLQRALRDLVARLRKRKFGLTDRPRRVQRSLTPGSRHVPDAVRRQVYLRDEGRCTFVSDTGRRCEAREHLEYDHQREFARGGNATVANIRLRCRAHNQFTAEQTFGAGFMDRKRDTSRSRPAGETTPASALAAAAAATSMAHAAELTCGLRELGFRAEEVRRAVAYCESLAGCTLEQQFRAAFSFLRPGKSAETRGVTATAPA